MSKPTLLKSAPPVYSVAARAQRAIVQSLAAIFLISLALAGGQAVVKQLRGAIQFYRSHTRPIPIEIERTAAYVRSQIPTDSALLLAVSKPDAWTDGLWQRALYPNPVFLLYEQDLGTPGDRELRGKYAVRFAVSIGDPPLNPGFRWQKPAPGWAGAGQVAFGEVGP